MAFWQYFLILLVLVSTVLAAPGAVPPPQSDPFYTPPSGYASQKPGAVLRSRSVSLALFGSTQKLKNAWQVLYRTTDEAGNPSATVTTIMEPNNADKTKFVSYQVAEDSVAPQCATSYQLRAGSNGTGTTAGVELLLIDALLEQGWMVSSPDYEGPNGAFLATAQTAQGVLDGIRAALAFSDAGISPTAQIAMWGYSGGALATAWSTELLPIYAPELKITTAAFGGVPVNITAALGLINKSISAALAFIGINGLSAAYPDLAQYVSDNLVNSTRAKFYAAKDDCLTNEVSTYAFQDVYTYFSNANPLNNPIPQRVLTQNTMGSHPYKIPVYMYQSTNDEIIPHQPVDDLYASYCAQGSQITYLRDIVSEHVTLAALGAPGAINHLKDRFAGKALAAGCSSTTVVTSALVPADLVTLGSVAFYGLTDFLGKPIGPEVTL